MVANVVVFAVCCTVGPHLNGHHFLQTSVPQIKADCTMERNHQFYCLKVWPSRGRFTAPYYLFVFRLWRPRFRGGRPEEGSLYCCLCLFLRSGAPCFEGSAL